MSMKKSFIWTLAAALTCGMAFTSCAKQDYPTPWNDPDSGWDNYSTNSSTVIDFEDEDDLSKFTVADASKMTTSIVEDETTGSKVAQFVRSGSSGLGLATLNFSEQTEDATTVKVAFDFNIKNYIQGASGIAIGDAAVNTKDLGGFSDGQWGFGANGVIMYFGGGRSRIVPGSTTNYDYFQINGVCVAAPEDDAVKAVAEPTWNRFTTEIWDNWLHFEADVDVANQTVSYTINKGDEVLYAGNDIPFVSDQALTCTQLSFHSGNAATVLFDNINITTTSGDASIQYADYTISYVDTEGNAIPEDLKTTITRRGRIGSAVTLLDADKANFSNADGSVKYIYQSDNTEGATITKEGTQIKIVYKSEEAPKYQYIFNCMIEGATGADAILAQIRGEEFEGKATTVYLPIGYYKDGKCYMTTPAQYNGRTVSVNGTEAKTQGYILTTINYALDESIVYFGECEDLQQEGEFAEGYHFGYFDRVSQGKTIIPKTNAALTTPVITAGTYDVNIFCRSDKGEVHVDMLYVKLADGTLQKVEALPDFVEYTKMKFHESMATLWNAGMGWLTFKSVTIPEGASLVIKNETTESALAFDCIKVTKIAAE